MNISLLKILHNREWDIRPDVAQGYANALKNAMELHIENDVVKQKGYFLSMKGTKTAKGNFQDKLYVDNIHYVLSDLYWNDEELADDDQIINVVWIDGPVTRDGGACSYGSKDWRDQVIYANTIPQVIGHLFIINTPGGESACRYDYDEMIADCRKNNKATVAYVDGQCCSSGVNLASRCDYVVVRNPKDEYGCIGSMAAFWATPDGAHDVDGTRYIEIVGQSSPEKNAFWRNAANGDYEKLQALIDKGTDEFHQTVRNNRPLVEDWMLSGDVFHADEVIPALVDEIGNMERAIECVQELAAGTLTAARFAKKEETAAEPEEKPAEPEEKPADNPEEKPADDPKEEVLHQNINNMTDDEKKAKETATVKAVQEQAAPAQNQQETDPNGDACDPDKKKDEEGQDGDACNPGKKKDEDDSNGDACDPGKKKDEDGSDGDACNPGKKKDEDDSNGDACDPGKKKDEDGSDGDACNPGKKKDEDGSNGDACNPDKKKDEDDSNGDACNPGKKKDEDLAKTQQALHTAEGMIADKDSKIADLQKQLEAKSKENSKNLAAIAERDKSIKERDEQVAKLKKQVADLKKEVSELAASPSPMNDAEGGVPADNGVGAPETGSVKSIVNANMSADEIRKHLREQDAKMAEKRRRR